MAAVTSNPSASRPPAPNRAAAAVLLVALALFLVLHALAALVYPGGTFCDPSADQYRFWGNFFCDLTQPVTQRGADNSRARLFAEASFVCFSVALAPFFWVLGGRMGRSLGRVTRVSGLISALGTNVIAWLPSRVSPELHQLAVFSAALPGLLAVSCGVYGLLGRGSVPSTRPLALRVSRVLGVLALVFGAADAAYYAYAVGAPGCHVWLPALQKVAALCLIGWMGSVAELGFRR
ncbi:MAG TPA: hypothetical protein VGK73_25525 [Polyangiaceae bacterium]